MWLPVSGSGCLLLFGVCSYNVKIQNMQMSQKERTLLHISTIGNGLTVGETETRGYGLYATRNFKRGEMINGYRRKLIDKDEALQRRENGMDSNICTIYSQFLHIDGRNTSIQTGMPLELLLWMQPDHMEIEMKQKMHISRLSGPWKLYTCLSLLPNVISHTIRKFWCPMEVVLGAWSHTVTPTGNGATVKSW